MPDSEARAEDAPGVGATAQQTYWASLYEQCHEDIRRYFARHVRCPHDVDDLVQDVFANLIVHARHLRDPRAYAYVVAQRQLFAYWWRKDRDVAVERAVSLRDDDQLADGSYCDYESDPANQLARRESWQTVALMMRRLSPPLAEALQLRFIDGLQPRETALRTGCSHAAIQKRLTRARQSLIGLCWGSQGV